MGGNEGQHVQWDAVDWNECVPPFMDGHRRGHGSPAKPGSLVGGGAVMVVSAPFPIPYVTHDGEHAVRF